MPETSSGLQGGIAVEQILLTSWCTGQSADYCTNIQVIEGGKIFKTRAELTSPEALAKFTSMSDTDDNLGTAESLSARAVGYGRAAWRENRQFLLLLSCIVFFKSAIADLSSISGASMLPTLLDGDKVWVNKLAYDVKIPFTEISLAELSDPQRGDIVIIDSERAGKRLVKRIVGIPGDTVYMQNNTLVINGVPAVYEVLSRDSESIIISEQLPEGLIRPACRVGTSTVSGRSYGPSVVPDDQYFVLGDNRDNSADSRIYSFVPEAKLSGVQAP